MYEDFVLIYDKFQEIDYNQFIHFYEEVFNKLGLKPQCILDLGCGSGNITIKLASRGYNVVGIDISDDMLSIAQNKAYEAEYDILFLNQDMRELDYPQKADVVISTLDCINYLTEYEDVKSTFEAVHSSLNDGGIFIFDINSEYKLSNILGNNVFTYEEDEAYCVWDCAYDPKDRICSFALNFFVEDHDGKYNRYFEYQEERAYTIDEITTAAQSVGFEIEMITGDLTFESPNSNTERIIFVLRKVSL